MNWAWLHCWLPALLFFGCVGGAALILFCQFVAVCDRIAEERYQQWLEARSTVATGKERR